MSGKRITIDPITRLEGHGKIEIFLDKKGGVEKAFLQVPELKGFERFCVGRPAEEMPRITGRICGVCPTAHHMAATKALDALYKVEPTPTARKLRELVYNSFFMEDHALHFYILSGPDFIVGPDAPKEKRNVLGVIETVGMDVAKQLLELRRRCRGIITYLGGKVIHPVLGLPGGVAKPLKKEDLGEMKETADKAVEFAKFTIKAFENIVLNNKTYVDLILGDFYKHETYYMGTVTKDNKVDFYDGNLRVVDPKGKEFAKFHTKDYLDHVSEHVEPWSYMKFCFLKKVGWKGFVDGKDSGVYRCAPLGRLNASDGMATPLAQKEYDKMYKTLGGKPSHHTLAMHWARVIEMMQAAETMQILVNDKDITGTDIRNLPKEKPTEGVGVVEAPRGTLFHHYKTDEKGILTDVNLIVATANNAAPISLSIEKAARSLIKDGKASDGLLNMIEMGFRAYDPCLACATHTINGKPALSVNIKNCDGEITDTVANY